MRRIPETGGMGFIQPETRSFTVSFIIDNEQLPPCPVGADFDMLRTGEYKRDIMVNVVQDGVPCDYIMRGCWVRSCEHDGHMSRYDLVADNVEFNYGSRMGIPAEYGSSVGNPLPTPPPPPPKKDYPDLPEDPPYRILDI